MSNLIHGCRVDAVVLGSILIADASHECLDRGEPCLVLEDNDGKLFVQCRKGRHYLDHHALHTRKADRYIGFALKEAARQ